METVYSSSPTTQVLTGGASRVKKLPFFARGPCHTEVNLSFAVEGGVRVG